MTNRPFLHGVHDLGNGIYGYIQPDGTWGFSNAGLIAANGEALLVDTLMSVPLTRQMILDFGAATGDVPIRRMVNTHANPDHFLGNSVLDGAEIISTEATAKGIEAFDATPFHDLNNLRFNMGETGEFLYETMGRKFDFSGPPPALPNSFFEDELVLDVGGKRVILLEVGPAHTQSDVMVHVPEDRIVFTGDILFNEGHPIMWAGPIENWMKACDRLLAMDVDVVVPGHGPIGDKAAVKNLRSYFEYIRREARGRFDAGMGWQEAARDINLQEFRGWSDPERIVANTFSLYRAWGYQPRPEEGQALFGAMGRYRKEMENGHDCSHTH